MRRLQSPDAGLYDFELIKSQPLVGAIAEYDSAAVACAVGVLHVGQIDVAQALKVNEGGIVAVAHIVSAPLPEDNDGMVGRRARTIARGK
jgi:hypothetical protein